MTLLDTRNVVTAFVRNPKTGKILLGLRSSKVRTFRGHWAGISGSIETSADTSPYQCACREIREETGLIVDKDIYFVRSGRPLLVKTTSDGTTTTTNTQDTRAYMVHPFLFHSNIENDEDLINEYIKIDWEHEKLEMFDPIVLLSQHNNHHNEHKQIVQFVPNLKEAYERIVLPNEHLFAPLIRSIRDNKTDGAATIAHFALSKVLRTIISHEEGSYSFNDIKNIAWFLYTARPTMAPIGNACLKAIASYLQSERVDEREDDIGSSIVDKQELLFHIDQVAQELMEYPRKIVHHTIQMIQNISQQLSAQRQKKDKRGITVLTFSFSSTVIQVLKSSGSYIRTLIISESRPDCEGLSTIESVCDSLKDTTEIILCTEATLPSIVLSIDEKTPVDLIITGVDAILHNGSVTNKTGTYLLALLSQHANIPIYFLCDSFKVRPRQQVVLPEELEQGSRESLLLSLKGQRLDKLLHLESLIVRNPIFETVPFMEHFEFITENGECSVSDLESISEQFQEYYELIRDVN